MADSIANRKIQTPNQHHDKSRNSVAIIQIQSLERDSSPIRVSRQENGKPVRAGSSPVRAGRKIDSSQARVNWKTVVYSNLTGRMTIGKSWDIEAVEKTKLT